MDKYIAPKTDNILDIFDGFYNSASPEFKTFLISSLHDHLSESCTKEIIEYLENESKRDHNSISPQCRPDSDTHKLYGLHG